MAGNTEDAPVRPAVRGFVYGFLALFLICGFLGFEVWPLSGFRLFSRVRTDRVLGWEVAVVDAAGAERIVAFRQLPAGYREVISVASGLSGRSERERLDVCRAWATEAAGGGTPAVEVRIYATADYLSGPGRGWRELRYSCDVRGEP